MRVIGGEFRSRRLKTLPGMATRPTADKLRETLFDVLGPAVEGSVWFDCYAGSGAVGIEALSRGAACVVFIEANRAAARVIRDNVAAVGAQERSRLLEKPVTSALRHLDNPADFVFLDPPYADAAEYRRALELLGTATMLAPGARIIAEHARRQPLDERYGALARYRVLEQGDNALSFYMVA